MIAAANISMRFGQRILFENVSVKFTNANRYGLIGANGVGKSTFMKILSDQLDPTSGEVALDQNLTMGVLKQDHYEYDKVTVLDTVYQGNKLLWQYYNEREDLYNKSDLGEISDKESDYLYGELEGLFADHNGYTMEADAAKLLKGLGLEEELHNKTMSELTGGLKLRVLLAQVLFAKPDVLLLDEPTNHLDMESISWLVNFLTRYEGTVVVISHDRYFLNSVCTHIADLDYQELRLFTGNYDAFMMNNEFVLEKSRQENKKLEKKATQLREFISRFGANASKAKQATARQKELEKLEFIDMKPSSRISPYIRFYTDKKLGDKVINAENITIKYDDQEELFAPFSCSISKNDKIAIIGDNGVGKTSLLKMLIGELKPTSGKVDFGETIDVSYFPQDTNSLMQQDISAIEYLAKYSPSMTETDLRSAMGKMLFRKNDVYKDIKVLSGGEKARLIISRMILQSGNILVLDEPTNHLDLEAIESLNYALSLVESTVIFVSHDREFVNSLATRIFKVEKEKIIDYPGNLEEWQAQNKKI